MLTNSFEFAQSSWIGLNWAQESHQQTFACKLTVPARHYGAINKLLTSVEWEYPINQLFQFRAGSSAFEKALICISIFA